MIAMLRHFWCGLGNRPLQLFSVAAITVGGFPAVNFAAVITGETAVASSQGVAHPPSLAVDNSGISTTVGNPLLSNNGDYVHSNNHPEMWFTLPGQGQGAALNQTITIDLQSIFNLDGMRVWNYNEGGNGTDTAIALYDLETSADNVNWILRQDNQPLAQAPGGGLEGYVGVYTAVNWTNTRYVRFTVLDTYRIGLDDIAGLSEVMFSGVQVPEPGSIALGVLGSLGLIAARRRCRSSHRTT